MDEKHKLWFIYDNNLVLPEYLIEFNYTMKSELTNKRLNFGNNTDLCFADNENEEFITSINMEKYKDNINLIFDNYVKQISEIYNEKNFSKKKGILLLNSNDLERCELDNLKILCLNYFKYSLFCHDNKFKNFKEYEFFKEEVIKKIFFNFFIF